MAAICIHALPQTQETPDHDAQLMLRAKRGDSDALGVLVAKYRAPIIRYVNRMVHDWTVSEDITQEVFLRVHRYRASYEVKAKFTTWLYRIAGHVTLNWIRDHAHANACEPLDVPRANGLRRYFVDGTIPIDQWLIYQREAAALRGALDLLPERQRRIVILHKFEDRGCDEIARIMGCSHQAVRSVLCRAYTALREILRDHPRAAGAAEGLTA